MNDNSIVKDFKDKSDIYYEKIYVLGKDPKRVNRLNVLMQLVRGDLKNNIKLLDAGSGPGILYNSLKKYEIEYYALDISPENIFKAIKEFSLEDAYIGDLVEMPFKSSYFDCVISLGCFEYIKDIESSISELSRVLKSGGTAYISFANLYSPFRIWHESVIKILMYVKYKIMKKYFYSRYLHPVNRIKRLSEKNNLEIETVSYLNEIFAGYPLSYFKFIFGIEMKVLKYLPFLKYLQSEYIIKLRKK
jgi:SAM-dependent methyltransferase